MREFFPFYPGDYIETMSGILCLICHNTWGSSYRIKYLECGDVQYGTVNTLDYKRHLDVNEITALKLMGLV